MVVLMNIRATDCDFFDQLKNEYGNRITPGKRSTREVIEYIKQNYGLISLNDINVLDYAAKLYVEVLQNNLLINSIKNDFKFEIYQLEQNNDTYKFYDYYHRHFKGDFSIYVYHEVELDKLFSNCSLFELKLAILNGVDETDIKNDTREYFNYLNNYYIYEDISKNSDATSNITNKNDSYNRQEQPKCMDIKKVLIDIEQEENKASTYFFVPEEGKKIEVVQAGKEIVNIPISERNHKVYKLFKENCDLIFCTEQKLEDFLFYPVPRFSIFAVDSEGNCFGTIGGMSDLINDVFPVGYVNRDGENGKISDSLKEFFRLVIYYPYWRDIIKYEQMGISYDINDMKMQQNDEQYFAYQREMAEILNLSKNPKSIELLISNIKNPNDFILYSSKKEAQMTNTFFNKTLF
jgi:hypothetical protein